jgi:HEAT repeat protein
MCLDAETGELIHHIPAATPGHVIAADGMVYTVETIRGERGKIPRIRVSLIKPTDTGFELAGRFMPELSDSELGLRDVDWQASANPVIADGRLFLRYGPLMAFELRADKTAEIRKRKARIANLVKSLDSDEPADQLAAVKALHAMGWQARPATNPLIEALRDEDETIRRLAGQTLGKIGPSVTSPLIGAMTDRQVRDDGFAAEALVAATGSKDVASALVAAAVASRGVRDNVKQLLPEYGAAGVPALRQAIATGDRYVRWWAIEVLLEIGPDAVDAVPELVHVTKVHDQWFRASAAKALGRIGPAARDAVPALTALCKHPYSDARAAAATALARIGVSNPQVVSALEAAEAIAEKNLATANSDKAKAGERSALKAAKAAMGTLDR